MATLTLFGYLAIRLGIAYVYLFALYMNVRDETSRKWLLDHTAYLFATVAEPTKSFLIKWAAVLGMLTMFVGGVSILLGLEGRAGALLLFVFTALGIYQHGFEIKVAQDAAARVAAQIPAAAQADFSTVQWSAYSGQFSSRLKNWCLCGVCLGLIALGTGPWSLSDLIAQWLKL
jgi:uncharacterized membrane protein YphA (DoxX/SURF4 family)